VDLSALTFQLAIIPITGVPEFDMFFSLTFIMGAVFFIAAEPIRLFLNRTK